MIRRADLVQRDVHRASRVISQWRLGATRCVRAQLMFDAYVGGAYRLRETVPNRRHRHEACCCALASSHQFFVRRDSRAAWRARVRRHSRLGVRGGSARQMLHGAPPSWWTPTTSSCASRRNPNVTQALEIFSNATGDCRRTDPGHRRGDRDPQPDMRSAVSGAASRATSRRCPRAASC